VIITFYSYKGGVGRTLALANVGRVLAELGHCVLTVDFDLEAPGLTTYYRNAFDRPDLKDAPGLIDLFQGSTTGLDVQKAWRDHVTTLHSPSEFGRLDLMTSGRDDDDYDVLVQNFDWRALFKEHGGQRTIETLRSEWSAYDFVLIDSRTGITDAGGVCTIHLPDILIPVFSTNEQSLDGAIRVIDRAQRRRREQVAALGPALVFPLPSKIDDRTEIELGTEWMQRFANKLSQFYEPWLPLEYTAREVLARTKLPYVSYYSFGERLPVEHPDSRDDAASLGYALRSAASLIASKFADVHALMSAGTSSETGDRSSSAAESWRRAMRNRSADDQAQAMAVLVRLAAAPDAWGQSIAVELLGGQDVIFALAAEGLVVVQRRMVRLADTDLARTWKPLAIELETRRDLLEWASRLREKAEEKLEYVLTGPELDESLEWFNRAPDALTIFERDLIEASAARRSQPLASFRMTRLRIGTIGLGMVVGSAIGAVTGWVSGSPLLLRTLVGFAIGCVVGALFGIVVAFQATAFRRRATATAYVSSERGGLRDLARAMSRIGYESQAVGDVVLFTMSNKAALAGGSPLKRLALKVIPDDELGVTVRPTKEQIEGHASGASSFFLEGPYRVIWWLEFRANVPFKVRHDRDNGHKVSGSDR
jgi:cellulose biosynthesis protein BcsQ